MSKKLFVALVVLMSLSLIGIIFVQAYYLNNSFKNEKERFTFTVKKALSFVSKKIEDEEYRDFEYKLKSLIQKGTRAQADTAASINLYIRQDDTTQNESYIYTNDILEKNYKLATSLFGKNVDSVSITRLLNERQSRMYNYTSFNGVENLDAMFSQIGKETLSDELMFKTTYTDIYTKLPIEERIDKKEVQRLLDLRLSEDEISIGYEFAIYNNNTTTAISSNNFKLHDATTYSVPIFYNQDDENNYSLLVDFPDSRKHVRSAILSMLLLSVLFTVVIIIAYLSSLYQLIKQRKISEIKSDFINNMTHEFKTPIATISLALDSIKNPKVIGDKEKIMHYLKMIKEENKRMHSQVENVLRISKLEKNELTISKEELDLHNLIKDAIAHLELIVENRSGEIKTKLNAKQTKINANLTHFTNVLVNILDNAIKYSPELPKIIITTYNEEAYAVVEIKDYGLGMSKLVQKRIFDKFYREQTGNIHNVKGHGLGLAYVKQIVDLHNGIVTVDSEKGKGSTFTIKIPNNIN